MLMNKSTLMPIVINSQFPSDQNIGKIKTRNVHSSPTVTTIPNSRDSWFARLLPSLRYMVTPFPIRMTGTESSAVNAMIDSALAVPTSWLPASAQSSGAAVTSAKSRKMQFLNLLLSSAREAASIPHKRRQGIASSNTLLTFTPIFS